MSRRHKTLGTPRTAEGASTMDRQHRSSDKNGPPSPSRFRTRRNAAVFLVETDQDQEEAEAAAAAVTDTESVQDSTAADASARDSADSAAAIPAGGVSGGGGRRLSRRGRNGYSYQFGWMNNKKFIKQLQKDNIDLAILQSEIGSGNTKRRRKSWKERLLYAIRSNVMQIILCAFVLIDAVIVIAEIILEIKAITSEKQELEDAFVQTAAFVNRTFAGPLSERGLLLPAFSSELTSSPQFAERLAASMADVLLALSQNSSIACNVTSSALGGSQSGASSPSPSAVWSQPPRLRRHALASGASATLTVAREGANRTQLTATAAFANFQQEFSHAKVLHDVSAVLHFVSIGILGLFVLEVALKIVCLGRNFVREKFEIVDAAVIMISFVADIVFVKVESTEVSVMVLFLLWRIVRVINGLMMHEKQRGEFRIQLQKRARRMSEMKCDTLETERDLQEKHILFLEELCRELGGGEEQIANCKPRFVNISKRQSNNALKSMAAMSAGIFGGIAGAQHRRSLSALTNNLGTPPSTSRQSSALDTIVEDAAATAATAAAAATATTEPDLDSPVEKVDTSTPSSPEADRPMMNGRPASSSQPPPPQEQQHRAGKRNSILQRQLYVEEEPQAADASSDNVAPPQDVVENVDENEADAVDVPDAGRCGFAGGMGAAGAAAAEIRLQDVRVDSGQYTTTGSDSDDEEDPWELQEYNYKFC